ncbi:major facilitator superfamily domain-containing protein 6-like [Acropora millepora]|uniref:major facilitator superfamily domain-containing protein 6-like n=1 Tax=Acropora millepora TaxID=45264 RepID=UPI001CF41CDC|nr:major facilitator superfamily domain-containing protein 6-like [Acropora millepora]
MSQRSSQDAPKASNVFSEICLKCKDCIYFCLFYFFFETCFSFKMFFFPVYWQQLGLSPTQIGILRAFWGVAYSVGAVLFGQIANKWKIRRALLLMSIASTVVTPLVSLLPRRTHDKCVLQTQKNARVDSPRSERFGRKHFFSEKGQGSYPQQNRGLKDLLSSALTRKESSTFYYHPSKDQTLKLRADHEEQYILKKSHEDINNIFIIFIFIVSIGEFLSSAAVNLANAEIVEFLGESSRDYGKIRLWGPIGHMIAAPSTAISMAHFHHMLCGEYQDNFVIVFFVIAIMAAFAFLSVTQFGSGQKITTIKMCEMNNDEARMSLTVFFAQYQNFIFICMTFLVGCFDGVILTFGFWYTKTLDVTLATLIFGLSRMTCSAVSVIFLGSIGMCVEKTGYTGVIIFSMLLFVSWFIGMSFMNNPWFMLIFETIGYIAYVVGFTGFISYFGEVTPPHLTDTVQGVVNSLIIGVGCGIGTALCGFLIDTFSAVNAFRLCAVGTVLVLAIFSVSEAANHCFKKSKKRKQRH